MDRKRVPKRRKDTIKADFDLNETTDKVAFNMSLKRMRVLHASIFRGASL